MDDFGTILIAVCGFSLLCLGLIALAAFITGRTVLAPMITSLFNRDNVLDDGEDSYQPRRSRKRDFTTKRKGAPSFSAQTAAVDPFDAAVQRHRQKRGDNPSGRTSAPSARPNTSPGDRSPFGSSLDSGRTSENRPLRSGSGLRRNRDRERDPDEIHDYDDYIDDEESFF